MTDRKAVRAGAAKVASTTTTTATVTTAAMPDVSSMPIITQIPEDAEAAAIVTIPEGLLNGEVCTTTTGGNVHEVQAVPLHMVLQPLPASKYVNSDYNHPSHSKNQGAIVQVRTSQLNGYADVIGAFRLPVSDPLDISGYLTENRLKLNRIGIKMLEKHMKNTNSHIGVGDQLTDEDYSVTLMVASVSQAGQEIYGLNRKEGGLWMLQYPNNLCAQRFDVLDPVTHQPMMESWQYVINMYVTLPEWGRRGNRLAQRLREKAVREQENARRKEEEAAAAAEAATIAAATAVATPPVIVKPPENKESQAKTRNILPPIRGEQKGPNRDPYPRDNVFSRSLELEQQVAMLMQKVTQYERKLDEQKRQVIADHFPPTPAPTRPLTWPEPEIPDVPPPRP